MKKYFVVLLYNFPFQVPLMGVGICLSLRTRADILIRFIGLAWTPGVILDELLGLAGP